VCKCRYGEVRFCLDFQTVAKQRKSSGYELLWQTKSLIFSSRDVAIWRKGLINKEMYWNRVLYSYLQFCVKTSGVIFRKLPDVITLGHWCSNTLFVTFINHEFAAILHWIGLGYFLSNFFFNIKVICTRFELSECYIKNHSLIQHTLLASTLLAGHHLFLYKNCS
jgi:hypothetical protein